MPEKKNKKKTLTAILLDETGSMESIKAQTLDGLNEYLQGLRDEDDVRVSLTTFNSNETRQRYAAKRARKAPRLTEADYRPNHMTPLVDAAMALIASTEVEARELGKKTRVVVVIQTDGQENCSREHTSADLAAKIREREAAGWQFLFLGAGVDAFAVAQHAGINLHAGAILTYGGAASANVYGRMLTKRVRQARRGKIQDFTDAERRKARSE